MLLHFDLDALLIIILSLNDLKLILSIGQNEKLKSKWFSNFKKASQKSNSKVEFVFFQISNSKFGQTGSVDQPAYEMPPPFIFCPSVEITSPP